jgi:predicted HNH restriction endonuclease
MKVTCKDCGKEYEFKRHTGCTTKKCASCYTKQRRLQLKDKAIEYKGGKCSICGYDKAKECLAFHHLDPSTKEFTLSRSFNRSWKSLQKELDKCILVCLNCHGEIHAGITGL